MFLNSPSVQPQTNRKRVSSLLIEKHNQIRGAIKQDVVKGSRNVCKSSSAASLYIRASPSAAACVFYMCDSGNNGDIHHRGRLALIYARRRSEIRRGTAALWDKTEGEQFRASKIGLKSEQVEVLCI